MLTLLLAATIAAHHPADTTLRLPRGTVVEISTFAAPVRVTGVAGSDVTVSGAAAELGGGILEIDAGPLRRANAGPVTVRVPTWATVVIETVNGEVVVTNAPDTLEVEAVDGRIAVTGGRGRMALSGTGAVEVRDFQGQRLSIEGLSGAIRVVEATGTIEVESVNGRITLEGIRSPDVQASTTNGAILWAGDLDPAGHYRFESHNGDIELRVPTRLSARLRLETFNGGFETGIPATTTGDGKGREGPPRERQITATFGRGQATVEISSFNGTVRVRPLGGT